MKTSGCNTPQKRTNPPGVLASAGTEHRLTCKTIAAEKHEHPPKSDHPCWSQRSRKIHLGSRTIAGHLIGKQFVNADVIARGLSAFDSETMAIQAGRIMLTRLHELAAQRSSFAFETTLASRSFARWVLGLKQTGYLFHLIYITLPSTNWPFQEFSNAFGRKGIIFQTRWCGGAINAGCLISSTFTVRWPLLGWYSNADDSGERLICQGGSELLDRVLVPELWERMKKEYENGTRQNR